MGVAFASRRQERRLRSQEAVERQRDVRKDRKAARAYAKAGDEAAASALELATVTRLVARRVVRGLQVEPIQHSHLYWSLKRLGHDVLLPEYRSIWPGGVRVLVEPAQSVPFLWWRRLSWNQRRRLTLEARRSVDAKPITPAVQASLKDDTEWSNPVLVVVRAEEHGRFEDPNQWGRTGGQRKAG